MGFIFKPFFYILIINVLFWYNITVVVYTRKMPIKSKIATLRKKAGISQAKLAVLIGVTTNTIQNWEKDDGLNQLEKYLKICEILGCKVDDLYEIDDEAPEEKESKSRDFSIQELRQLRERWKINVKK